MQLVSWDEVWFAVEFEEASGKKIYEHDSMSTIHFCNMGSAISKILRELDTEISYLKGRIYPVEDLLEALKSELQNKVELLLQQHQDRIEQLINEHDIEITGLTEKASSAQTQANCIQSQLEIMQEQARNQISMYICQLSDLEPTVSQLRSELRENVISQKSGNLDDWLHMLLADLHKREKELSLEKEQNKHLWDQVTRNSITIDHLRQVLDDRNLEVQHLEALLNDVKNECQGQMEWQMQQFREGTKV
ncbi:hypothetical protein MC885_007151 [Smutsia gigantea]|nr:hypothetical protein MC885_007151 [Smutsia gigantea]